MLVKDDAFFRNNVWVLRDGLELLIELRS